MSAIDEEVSFLHAMRKYTMKLKQGICPLMLGGDTLLATKDHKWRVLVIV